MSYYKGPLILPNNAPVVADGNPHNCYFPTGWNKPYSHMTVAVILTNETGKIAAVVARHPDEPAEGGKLSLPGGYVELEQTLANAAETEVLEETGHLILPKTLRMFALMDGSTDLPGRTNENDGNVVAVFSALAGKKVQEHDAEVTDVLWIDRDDLPARERIAFGHFDIMGMWFRHQEESFASLPIAPSGMKRHELFLSDWLQ